MSLEIRNWTFNGLSLGEAGLQAAIAGHYGVPFVFVTGDVYACEEMEQLLPGIVTVPVKVGLSRLSALQWTPAQAREEIRDGAERALKVVGQIAPLRLESPILFRDERVKPTFDEEDPPPHSRVIDTHTREIEGEDIIDLMHKMYTGYPRGWKPRL
jgi:D-amino peptidase